MMKNILLATALILTPHLSLADEQAERASIEELLEVSNVKSMIDAMHDQLGQMLEQMSTQLQVDESEKPIMDKFCLLYTSPSPRDKRQSRMPSSA